MKIHARVAPMIEPDGTLVFLTKCGRVVKASRATGAIRCVGCKSCKKKLGVLGQLAIDGAPA